MLDFHDRYYFSRFKLYLQCSESPEISKCLAGNASQSVPSEVSADVVGDKALNNVNRMLLLLILSVFLIDNKLQNNNEVLTWLQD